MSDVRLDPAAPPPREPSPGGAASTPDAPPTGAGSSAGPAPPPTAPARDGAEPPPRAGAGDGGDLRRLVLGLGTNVAVITGLLVYFGWKRADTQSRFLGVDESIFGLSTADYVLRSVDALFVPIAVAAFAGLGWLWVDGRVRRRLERGGGWPALDRATRVLLVAWAWGPALVFAVGQLVPRVGLFGFPLSFGVGVLLSVYAVHLRRRTDPDGAARSADEPWRVTLTKAFVGVVVVLSLFWAITNYATFRGVSLALELAAGVDELPRVVVYSPARLAIDAPGVVETGLGQSDGAGVGGEAAGPAAPGGGDVGDDAVDGAVTSTPPAAYAFRYDGLRLLDRIGDRVFLLSDGYTRRYGVVVVLPEDGDLRYEFVHDERPRQ